MRYGARLVPGSGRSPDHAEIRHRRLLQDPHDALDDVVDVGEVPLHPTLVEHVDRPSLEDRPGEEKERHVGPSPGSVHREEAEARARETVQVSVAVGHQLVGLLRRGIQAQRVVHVVVHGEREPRVRAVHRARRGEDQVLDTLVTAALEDVEEPDHVRVDVGVRVRERVAHPGLCGQVDHAGGPVAPEELGSWPSGRSRPPARSRTRDAASAGRGVPA